MRNTYFVSDSDKIVYLDSTHIHDCMVYYVIINIYIYINYIYLITYDIYFHNNRCMRCNNRNRNKINNVIFLKTYSIYLF